MRDRSIYFEKNELNITLIIIIIIIMSYYVNKNLYPNLNFKCIPVLKELIVSNTDESIKHTFNINGINIIRIDKYLIKLFNIPKNYYYQEVIIDNDIYSIKFVQMNDEQIKIYLEEIRSKKFKFEFME